MKVLDSQNMRSIGALKFDPGFILLLDLLQSRLDDLTDDLSEPALSSDEAHNKLRHWQAFREILNTLKTIPANYLQQPETKDAEEPLVVDPSIWQRLAAQQYDRFEADSLE